MFRKSLYLAGALAGALVWSAAAAAAPGQATGNVNMRSGPGTAYPVITQIPAGAPVDIINCSGWCELSYAGRDGYVSANFVAAARSAPAPSYAYDPYYDYSPGLFDNFYTDNGPYENGFGVGHHFRGGGFGGGHHGYGGGMGGGHGRSGGGQGWGDGGGHGFGGGGGHGFGGGMGGGGHGGGMGGGHGGGGGGGHGGGGGGHGGGGGGHGR